MLRVMMSVIGLAVVAGAALPAGIQKAYVGTDGLVHIVDGQGKDRATKKEKQQVAVGAPVVSGDGMVAGWTVEEENCCTSYPIATSVVLMVGAGKKMTKRVVAPGQMVWDWCFVDEGNRVAVASGAVHGMVVPELHLYATATGQVLKERSSGGADDVEGERPDWAACLRY